MIIPWRDAPSMVPSSGDSPFLVFTVPVTWLASCLIDHCWFKTPSVVLKICTFQLPAILAVTAEEAAGAADSVGAFVELYKVLSPLTMWLLSNGTHMVGRI